MKRDDTSLNRYELVKLTITDAGSNRTVIITPAIITSRFRILT